MLEAHRQSVALAASNLQKAGLIRYSRRKLRISAGGMEAGLMRMLSKSEADNRPIIGIDGAAWLIGPLQVEEIGMAALSDPSKVKVLLVDDEPANRLALRAVLEGIDLTLVEAQSGEEALSTPAGRVSSPSSCSTCRCPAWTGLRPQS